MSISCPPSRRLLLVVLLATLGVASRPGRTDDGNDPSKARDVLTAITPEQLATKIPNFYCFDYHFGPVPGKRLWLRVDDKHFVERYPDGTEARFLIIGHANVHDMEGTIVIKVAGDTLKTQVVNDGAFQVFIPDKGNAEMQTVFRYLRDGSGDWLDNARSLGRKTILQKVE